MLRLRFPCIVIIILILMGTNAFSQDSGHYLKLKNRVQSRATLLSVRDTALVVDFAHQDWEQRDSIKMMYVRAVRIDTIEYVLIEGTSNVLVGILGGAVIGAFLGGVYLDGWGDDGEEEEQVNTSDDDAEEASSYGGAILGSIVGALAGLYMGITMTTADEELDPSVEADLIRIRELAMFEDEEPDFLRKIE